MEHEPDTEQGEEGRTGLRLAEMAAAFSLAADGATARPWEHGLQGCLLAIGLGEAAGFSEPALDDVYYTALLRWAGCTADPDAARTATGGDPSIPIAPNGPGRGLAACEVARMIADRLGLGREVRRALGEVFEWWDGRGGPVGVKGDAQSPAARVVHLAEDTLVVSRRRGVRAALDAARDRSGSVYDPALVGCFLDAGPELLAHVDASDAWARVVDSVPVERPALDDGRLEEIARAMADFVDLKTRYTLGHSSGVAALAGVAARELGLPEAEVVELRRAGLLHDLGRAAVTTSVWEKAQPLSADDWERIRLHAYRSERILARPEALARLGELAGAHHERLDGSGYHRGSPAWMQPIGVRVLAAADAYRAMTEPRPHRPAFGADAAAEELRREVRTGRLDGDAVRAVLAAAGRVGPREPGALSGREVEVLNLLARGLSHREIGDRLFVAREAVDQLVQHLLAKLGCSTAAGATFFALEHGLVDAAPETTVRPR